MSTPDEQLRAGQLAHARGDLDTARELWGAALDATAHEPSPITLMLLMRLGMLEAEDDNLPTAIRFFEIGRDLADAVEEPVIAAKFEVNLAVALDLSGDREAMRFQLQSALPKFIAGAVWADAADAAVRLARSAHADGEFAAEVPALQHAISAFDRLGDARSAARFSIDLGVALRSQGRFADAEIAIDEAIRRSEAAGSRDDAVRARIIGAELLGDLGDHVGAIERLRDLRDRVVDPSDTSAIASCDIAIGNAAESLGDLDAAWDAYERVRRAIGGSDPGALATCDLNTGIIARQRGLLDEARHRLASARAHYEQTGQPHWVAACDLNLGNVETDATEYESALEHFAAARAFFVQRRNLGEVSRCDLALARSAYLHWVSMPVGVRAGSRLVRFAATFAVPVALLLAADRALLATDQARRRWMEQVAAPAIAIAFAASASSGESELVAALIEDARSTGVFSIPDAAEHAMTAASDARVVVDNAADGAPPTASAFTASTAVCRLIGASGYRLDPPVQLKRVGGEIVLADQLAEATRRYPGAVIRSTTTLTPTGVGTALRNPGHTDRVDERE